MNPVSYLKWETAEAYVGTAMCKRITTGGLGKEALNCQPGKMWAFSTVYFKIGEAIVYWYCGVAHFVRVVAIRLVCVGRKPFMDLPRLLLEDDLICKASSTNQLKGQ